VVVGAANRRPAVPKADTIDFPTLFKMLTPVGAGPSVFYVSGLAQKKRTPDPLAPSFSTLAKGTVPEPPPLQ